MPWRPGRIDKPDGTYCPSDGRLPDASQGAAHIRAVGGRMGRMGEVGAWGAWVQHASARWMGVGRAHGGHGARMGEKGAWGRRGAFADKHRGFAVTASYLTEAAWCCRDLGPDEWVWWAFCPP